MASTLTSNGGAASSSGLSLILIATEADSLTSSDSKTLLSNALHTRPITDLHILGPSSANPQALRTEAYSLAGKLHRNLSVTLHDLPSEPTGSQISASLDSLSLKAPHGVLLLFPTDPASGQHTSPTFLDLPPSDLQALLNHTIALIHTIARATIPLIPAATTPSPSSPRPFFAIHPPLPCPSPASEAATSPSPPTRTSTARSLHSQLLSLTLSSLSSSSPHVDAGYAHTLLPPPVAEKVDEKITPKLRIHIPGLNGGMGHGQRGGAGHGQRGGEEGWEGEEDGGSPTKLWAEWALLEDG
ncbi:hypothetical protein BDZ85DRAFT_319783 [Elsinoe ampelina]|uniref:Uncharacterized protein n=1 Tax=Elsinoe ampelina TaxID=302913 RepID=A0A6A6GA26_9PEZI|nr:hypothetical protein BDZ85DRAFT_319783 [Elsinoe ampelina]